MFFSAVPPGLLYFFIPDPAMNCRAIVFHPYGVKAMNCRAIVFHPCGVKAMNCRAIVFHPCGVKAMNCRAIVFHPCGVKAAESVPEGQQIIARQFTAGNHRENISESRRDGRENRIIIYES